MKSVYPTIPQLTLAAVLAAVLAVAVTPLAAQDRPSDPDAPLTFPEEESGALDFTESDTGALEFDEGEERETQDIAPSDRDPDAPYGPEEGERILQADGDCGAWIDALERYQAGRAISGRFSRTLTDVTGYRYAFGRVTVDYVDIYRPVDAIEWSTVPSSSQIAGLWRGSLENVDVLPVRTFDSGHRQGFAFDILSEVPFTYDGKIEEAEVLVGCNPGQGRVLTHTDDIDGDGIGESVEVLVLPMDQDSMAAFERQIIDLETHAFVVDSVYLLERIAPADD